MKLVLCNYFCISCEQDSARFWLFKSKLLRSICSFFYIHVNILNEIEHNQGWYNAGLEHYSQFLPRVHISYLKFYSIYICTETRFSTRWNNYYNNNLHIIPRYSKSIGCVKRRINTTPKVIIFLLEFYNVGNTETLWSGVFIAYKYNKLVAKSPSSYFQWRIWSVSP